MNLFKQLAGRRSSKPRSKSGKTRRFTPAVEALEGRDVPSTLLILDFDGATAAEYGRVQAQLYGVRASDVSEGFSSFLGGFRTLQAEGYANYSFLDFNGDRRLDEADGNLAANLILQRVREDFAPYDVTVVREDNSDVARARMSASAAHDSIIFIDGRDYSSGLAPVDPGNTRDDSGWAGGSVGTARKVRAAWLRGELTEAEMRDAFVQDLAMGASHEAGHTFGLQHVIEPRAWDISIMAGGNYRNQVFADLWYDSEGSNGRQPPGRQNEHQYLREVLGPSAKPWAAVLTPGVLTITGSAEADYVSILRDARGDWLVTVTHSGPAYTVHTYRVDPSASPDINSVNRFSTSVSRIGFRGGAGDDQLYMTDAITARVHAYGGAGNDTLYGGGASDLIYGEEGNDVLHGQGGNDTLDGGSEHDTLRGGAGIDWLFGQTGNDTLYGGADGDVLMGGFGSDRLWGEGGNDYLDGGHDEARDYLYGGPGIDTFVDHQHQRLTYDPWRGWYWVWVSEDALEDFNPAEDVRRVLRWFD